MEHLASNFSHYEWLAVVVEEHTEAANKIKSFINLYKIFLSAQMNFGGPKLELGGRNSNW